MSEYPYKVNDIHRWNIEVRGHEVWACKCEHEKKQSCDYVELTAAELVKIMKELARDSYLAAERIAELEDVIEEIATMKIPYCDANDVAHYMRDAAKDALSKQEKDNDKN